MDDLVNSLLEQKKTLDVSADTIANRSGVSVSTVRRILNGNRKVKAEKRRRVEAAIASMNADVVTQIGTGGAQLLERLEMHAKAVVELIAQLRSAAGASAAQRTDMEDKAVGRVGQRGKPGEKANQDAVKKPGHGPEQDAN